MTRTRSYILATAPRSGSTLLCTLLAATGQAGAPDSHVHHPSVARWAEALGMQIAPDDDSLSSLRRVLEAVRIAGEGGTGMFGLRLQRHSMPYLMAQLDRLHPGLSESARLSAAFDNPRYLHLRRGDELGQAISLVRAQQTGLWHRAADGSELERLAPPAEPRYDRDALSAALAESQALNAGWEAWFRAEGVVPLSLTYEELARDPGAVLARVLDFLGLDPAMAEGVEPGTQKLADAVSDSWRARYLAGC